MKLHKYILYCLLLATIACKHASENETEGEPKTPVTVTTITHGPISERIVLNATSTYQRKHTIKAFVSAYIKTVKVTIGQSVKPGEVLFTLTTKEAVAYNSLNIKDSSFLKPSDLLIKATSNGIVSTIDHQLGEYVQEGDQLCTIAESQSMVFILEVPYELHDYAKINNKCVIRLPDGNELDAIITSLLPQVDVQAQTQKLIIKPTTDYPIPENLLATIYLVKSVKQNAVTIPKEALLSNETQSLFWVMKLINDSTAIKVPVTIGIKSTDKIEIVTPVFSDKDRILTSGNYGLADTAKVSIK